MNWRPLIFVFLLLALSNCQKVTLCSLLQTDSQGNIIERCNSKDWITQSVRDEHETTRTWENYINDYAKFNNFDTISFNYNCTTNSNDVSIFPYPNPISNTKDLMLRMSSLRGILFFKVHYHGLKKYDGGGSASGFSTNKWGKALEVVDFNLSTLMSLPKDDLFLEVYVVTKDYCVHYAEGNVLVK